MTRYELGALGILARSVDPLRLDQGPNVVRPS